jgi:hypothetical protein
VAENEIYIREDSILPQRKGFTLNKEKSALCATKIKYLGSHLPPRGVQAIHKQIRRLSSFLLQRRCGLFAISL